MSDIFIGRQPIFDRKLEIYAYELLFRGGENMQQAGVIDGDSATSQVMLNTYIDIGLDNLVGNHKAFINLTEYFLLDADRVVIPPQQTVLEVLEDIEASETVVSTLKTLKQRGHTIALDDFIYRDNLQPLVDLADLVKIDIMALNESEIAQHARQLKHQNITILAEKIETYAEFESLKAMEFDLFQGYFFAKPVVIKGKGLPANKVAVLRLLAQVNNPAISMSELSDIVGTDVSLSHKILKFINSSASGVQAKVESIQHAVVMLGMNTIKNWASLLAMTASSDKTQALCTLALTRARSCELLGEHGPGANLKSYFTVGLFSLLEALMDQPLFDLLEELPLPDDLKDALLKHSGPYGEALECALAMERNDFSKMNFAGLELSGISEIYLQALLWSEQQSKLLR